MAENTEVDVFDTPEGLKRVADYLRGTNGVKVRQSVEHERRVEYFKGEKLIECLLKPTKWPSSLPKITTEEQAINLGQKLIKAQYFHRSEKRAKDSANRKELVVSPKQIFEPKGYYTWMYLGSQTWSNVMTGLIILGFLFMTCFPIWPMFLKVWLWYASVSLLGFTFGFLLIRFLLFLFAWLIGFDFWLFPRLFDETLGFTESFTPTYSLEKSSDGQGWYRLAIIVALGGFFYWAYSQPTDFDHFIAAQKQFVSDIYEGNLLADVAQQAKENIDKPRVPNLDDLLRELDEEISEEKSTEDEIIEQLMQEAEEENQE